VKPQEGRSTRKAVRWIAPALVCAVVAAVALIIVEAVAGGSKHRASSLVRPSATVRPRTPTATTRAARPRPKRRRTATPRVTRSGRCGEIAVNAHTSCPFARVVVEDYDARPSSTFLARSPVTGLTYTMHCEHAHGVVTCDDNSTSTLAFRAPSP
jgi:hypothetical protein